MPADATYEREIRVAASPATIFELLTDPVLVVTWMGFEATVDPRPGGVFRLGVGPSYASGTFVEVEPNQRVVFTWGWEGDRVDLPPGSSTVEFTLIPDGDHTVVRLRHSGLDRPLAVFHGRGWDLYLPRLAAAATGEEPGADPLSDPAAQAALMGVLAREIAAGA